LSGAGINPLAIYDPATYAQQIAIQRRQALAQSLMQQGEQDPGHSAYGGLRNAGNAILGAFLAKRADQQLGNLYNPQSQQGAQDPGQLSNSAGSGPIMSSSSPSNPSPVANASQPPSPQQQAGQGFSPGNNPPDYALLPPQAKRIYDQIPHIPGMPAQQALNYFLTNPQGYQAEWVKNYEATPEQKNAAFVNPGDINAQRTAIGGIQTKAGTVTGRAGNVLIGPDGKTNYVPPQAPPGYRYVQGQDGQPYLVGIGGGLPAIANSGMAASAGKAAVTPFTAFDAQGMPVATNNLAMTGNPAAQNLIGGVNPQATAQVESGGNPNAVSPRGAVGPMQTMPGTNAQPGFGVQPAQANTPQEQGRVGSDYLGAMMDRYKNPVAAHIAYNMGPGATDKWIQDGADFNKLPQETRDYLGRTAIAQAFPQRPQGGLSPALPASQQPYMAGQGKDASDRHDQTIAQAEGAPDRINVLDNIINLSQSGVATGPGQDFQNHVLGYVANLPGLSKVMGAAKDNQAKFQELQKFLLQNGQRAWQAAGGTGTDAQLDAASHANPNDAQFPQALQTISKWVKAGELAVQAKANAQDSYLQARGNTAQNQIAFENAWRNSLDRRVFQLQTMGPQEQQAFIKSLSPTDAKTLLQKRQALRSLGAIQ